MSVTSDFWKAMNQSGTTVSNAGSSGKKTSGGVVSSSGSSSGTSTKKKKKSITEEFWEAMGDDDIAPVKSSVASRVQARASGGISRKKDKEDEDDSPIKLFQKGAFEDGFDWTDIPKVILGTAADAGLSAVRGAAGLGEGIGDAIVYGAAEVGDLIGMEERADQLRKNAQVSQVDRLTGSANEWLDQYSVLGRSVDAGLQGVGQMVGLAGATAGIVASAPVSVPAVIISGGLMALSGVGQGYTEAYEGDATDEEARKHALNTGVSDALSEMVFGAMGKAAKVAGLSKGLTNIDDVVAIMASKKFKSQATKNLVEAGVKMSAEGLEEVISGTLQAVSKYNTYMSEEDFNKILKDENLAEQFFAGALTAGVMQSGYVPGMAEGSVREANKTGRDFITGQTQNEQAVIQKELENRIAEAEKEGKKLTSKQKQTLEEQVVKDMEKGYISIDTIEEVLGGGTYSLYKNTADSEDAILKEYDELGKKTNATLADQARYNELTQQVKDIRENSQRNTLKTQLGDEVFNLVKGDRLAESYNERSRRGQAFEADLAQYDAKQQAVIQKAVDSGILNNTNRTHEFVDMVAKISADKGVLFDFTNNAKLKDSGFAVEGKQVNGYVTKDGITLNIDSPKAMESTVGHEITHVMEGTEFYDALKQTLFDYAKTKGEYQTRYDSMTEMYKDIKDADIDNELAADLVGDYLFNDTDFIKNLSTQNRNVFQKIYDEIKYLCKVVTAGSKEGRELERVKKAFEDAYREGGKTQGETKYSVSDKNIKDISTGYSHGESYYTMSYMQDGKAVGTLQYGEYDGEANVKMIEVDPEYRRKGIATKLLQELQNKYDGTEIDFGMSTPDGTKLLESITYDVTDEAVVADRQKFKDLQAELNDLQEKLDVLYDTENLTEEQDAELHRLGDRWQEVYESIHELSENLRGKKATRTFVKTDAKYSLSDSTGKQLTKEQQDYFKDSKARDDNGNLIKVYHSSPTAGFTVFDGAEGKGNYKYGDYGDGITFFTDNKAMADSYSPSNEKVDTTKLNSVAEAKEWLRNIGAEHLEIQGNNGRFDLFDTDEDELVYAYYSEEELLRDVKRTVQEEYGDIYAGGQYEGYVNLKNPLEVDAEGRFWDRISEEFSQEVYDKFQSLTAEEKAALEDLAGWEDASLFVSEIRTAKNANSQDDFTKNLASAFNKLKDKDDYVNLFNLYDIASEGFTDEAIRESATVTLSTNDYVEKALQDGSYDGVIIKNVVDYGGHAMSNAGSTSGNDYIVFNSNQFKAAGNLNPTEDADIRYSLADGQSVKVLDGGSVAKYSLSTWTPEMQTKVSENLVKAGFEKADVDKWIQDTNSIAAVIAKDKERLDFEAHENHTMVKDNLDYYKTVEASTLCAKRLKYQGTFDAIQHRLPNTTLTSDMLIELREMMKKNGHEVPCGACYVESRRRHLGKYATDWLKTYDAEFIPTLADVTTTDGLEKLRTEHPQTYKDFTDAMKKKGVSNPKVVELRTEYRGEIMKISDAIYKKIMKIGGLRLQSFSDFETPHLLDMMQVVNDMASRKFVSQAYTKVPNFAWVLGDTNIKINLSLIPGGTGVDANGELIFDPKEGMPIEDALQLRDRYSKNVGTTIIGINDEHILKCMADDRIDYIIPFHRSGWGAKELSAMGLDSYVDYTAQQKERDIKTGKGVPNIDEMSYWDFSKSGKENAEAYLALCAEKGVIPKFDKFLVNNGDGSYSLQPDGSTDGYWKTLINFKMYDNDGFGSPHQAVVPNFNMEEAYRVLNEYEGGANSLPVANDVVEEFVAKYNEAVAPVMSLSEEGEKPVRPNYSATMGEDIALQTDDIAPVAETSEVPVTQDAPIYESNDKTAPEGQTAMFEPVEETPKRTTRKELHQNIIDSIIDRFDEKGFDFDTVLKKAKNLSTWSTVDNTPQRVMEKALGYKEGGILADITVNKVAQNESEGIKWVNENVKLLKDISKQYHIKPGSKESAAAQMYAEGFYVNENNEIVRYGDPELIQDFRDPIVRQNIKSLARDPRIRKIYDDTLASINESRTRNAYPEIPRLDNYFLHFRAMNDTFSTLGLPFNPNDIRAKDLPTDLNGVTADLKPGQPYFASAMHRKGKRTSFDMLGGIERYLNSAKNQIYHIDDIQTLRALRNYIAETYGQATGLEDIDSMTDAEVEERIKQVYGSHLSTFAKFLNEEANVLAGKTALIDRGLEGIIGRRGITFLNTLNGQVGSNMVGYNISSSLTNFLPVAQTFAKTNKFDFTKAFAQTVANKVRGGRLDSFAEDSPVVIRRKGTDRFYQTPWQKMQNPGYVLMSAVDDISTELIARTKYNEFTRKGMDSQKAHFETDKWVSKLMGDRSLGQQPQLYNSKMLGLVTKFQLEVRNQLDSQFYDTIQETKVSNEHIQNELARNAVTAAKVASTFTQLAVVQHLFGKAFESVAGYNPAFDIIEVLMTAFGFDDDEESEDTVLDNLEQGFFALLEDLPYTSTFTGGGRIPISSALPIGELVKGEDQYGNEKSRWETLGEVAPYYLMPAGYGQVKKTKAGLEMFSDEHPIAGSYTDAGNLRFPVEDTMKNKIQAGIFGQYASETARKYFDEEQRTLNPDQTAIFAELDIPIEEYWEYRDNLYAFYDVKDQLKEAASAEDATDEDILKSRYINAVYSDIYELYDKQKKIASGNTLTKKTRLREIQRQMEDMLSDSKDAIDNIYINGYYATIGDKRFDYSDYNGAWFEIKGEYLEREQKAIGRYGITPEDYWNNTDLFYHADYYFKYSPELEDVSKRVFDGKWFAGYAAEVSQIKGDDFNNDGKTDTGTKKKKVFAYIDGLDVDDIEKKILRKMSYPSEDKYNYEIIDYLNNRDDISYDDMNTILEALTFKVDSEGYITWD